MHPLRFPNGSIRAKVFVRKISFKLRVMRLNRVELFYALVAAKVGAACGGGAATCMLSACRGSPLLATCKGLPATARPPARGGHLRARPTAANPQGRSATVSPLGPIGSGQLARGCRSRPALPPTGAAAPVVGVAAPWQCGCRPQRATAACAGVAAAAAQLQRYPRCRGRRSRCMVMRRSDGTDDDEINNHRAWRCANAHINSIVSD
ncbi:hypothetical protein BHE74_00006926 [Ensete ventricosum]|nr:hypothetical protein BHE74_00006926 [Ensete ventricosum]